jgi:hypothetical protein
VSIVFTECSGVAQLLRVLLDFRTSFTQHTGLWLQDSISCGLGFLVGWRDWLQQKQQRPVARSNLRLSMLRDGRRQGGVSPYLHCVLCRCAIAA